LEWRVVANTARSSKPLKVPETSNTGKTLEILGAESRSEQARKAVRARWDKSVKQRDLKKFLTALTNAYIQQFGEDPELLSWLAGPVREWLQKLKEENKADIKFEEETEVKTNFVM
jgi:hypothetical protein